MPRAELAKCFNRLFEHVTKIISTQGLELKILVSALKKKASDLAFPLPAHNVVQHPQDHLAPPAGLWLSPVPSAGSHAVALPPSALPADTGVTQPT